MVLEFIAVFIWMLAVYASIFSWRVKRSGDYMKEVRILLLTASITVPMSLIIGEFGYFVFWYCLATLLALGVVTSYALANRQRQTDVVTLDTFDSTS